MAQAKRNTARNTRGNKVEQFNVAAWRERLNSSFSEFASAATKALHTVLEGRGLVEADTAREAIGDAFVAAGMERDSKTWKNRVADVMVIFNAKSLPDTLPSNLQHAAAAVRKHKLATGESTARKPRPGATGTKPQAGDPAPLVALAKAIERVRSMDGLSEAALELVGELIDLAGDLAAAVLNPTK